MTNVVTKVARSIAERGVFGTIRYIPKRAAEIARDRYDREFDRRHGTDTSGVTALKELSFDSSNKAEGLRYEPISAPLLRQVLKRIPVRHEDYTFIDYGSGKGRVLFLASDYPFKKIIGVEFAPSLHEITVNNIKVYRSPAQRCHDIESVCMDAVQYQPPDGPLMCFFYSPFKPKLFNDVLTNLKAALDAKPRKAILIFYGRNPESIKLFADRWPTSELPLPRDWTRSERYRAFVSRVG